MTANTKPESVLCRSLTAAVVVSESFSVFFLVLLISLPKENMQRTRYQQTTVLSGAPRNPQRVLLSYPGKKEIKKKAIRVRWEAVDLCDGGREARLPTIYLASLICGRKHQTMTTDKRRARTSPFVCCIASLFHQPFLFFGSCSAEL